MDYTVRTALSIVWENKIILPSSVVQLDSWVQAGLALDLLLERRKNATWAALLNGVQLGVFMMGVSWASTFLSATSLTESVTTSQRPLRCHETPKTAWKYCLQEIIMFISPALLSVCCGSLRDQPPWPSLLFPWFFSSLFLFLNPSFLLLYNPTSHRRMRALLSLDPLQLFS